jgi:hypothetical protein
VARIDSDEAGLLSRAVPGCAGPGHPRRHRWEVPNRDLVRGCVPAGSRRTRRRHTSSAEEVHGLHSPDEEVGRSPGRGCGHGPRLMAFHTLSQQSAQAPRVEANGLNPPRTPDHDVFTSGLTAGLAGRRPHALRSKVPPSRHTRSSRPSAIRSPTAASGTVPELGAARRPIDSMGAGREAGPLSCSAR